MAKPNYQFEKRQRDLAKKAKQEEKRRQKVLSKPDGTDGDAGSQSGNGPDNVGNAALPPGTTASGA